MARFDALTVLWRAPDDGTRFSIGRLWREPVGFAFEFGGEYSAAVQRGFPELVELPAPHSGPYRSPYLFATFAQRVPSPRRADFSEMMQRWGVECVDNHLEILARSGGTLMTDRLELAEDRELDDPLTDPLEFRIAGMRYYPDSLERLSAGQHLGLEREPQNAYDQHATLILTLDGAKLGYVPRQYSRLIASHLDAGHQLDVEAVRRLAFALPGDDRWVVSVKRQAS